MTKSFSFSYARNQVEQAAAKAKADRQALYRDGKSMYSPEVHTEKMARVMAPLQDAVADALRIAGEADAHARSLNAMKDRDPLWTMPTDVLQRMAALRPFVAEQIEAMPFEELAPRLRAVAAFGDTAAKYLYLTLATKRTDVRIPAMRSTLDSLEAAFTDPEAAKATEEAKELATEAAQLSFFASSALAEADGSREAADRQRVAGYGGRF
jgi:hypothetical protein